jgi:hypothetical protein
MIIWVPAGNSEEADCGDGHVLRAWPCSTGWAYTHSQYGQVIVRGSADDLEEAREKAEGALEDWRLGGLQ